MELRRRNSDLSKPKRRISGKNRVSHISSLEVPQVIVMKTAASKTRPVSSIEVNAFLRPAPPFLRQSHTCTDVFCTSYLYEDEYRETLTKVFFFKRHTAMIMKCVLEAVH